MAEQFDEVSIAVLLAHVLQTTQSLVISGHCVRGRKQIYNDFEYKSTAIALLIKPSCEETFLLPLPFPW